MVDGKDKITAKPATLVGLVSTHPGYGKPGDGLDDEMDYWVEWAIWTEKNKNKRIK